MTPQEVLALLELAGEAAAKIWLWVTSAAKGEITPAQCAAQIAALTDALATNDREADVAMSQKFPVG